MVPTDNRIEWVKEIEKYSVDNSDIYVWRPTNDG